MDQATQQQVFGVIRTLCVAVGSWAVGKGFIPSDILNALLAAGAVLGPLAWSIWEKQHAEKATQAREEQAINKGIAIADATAGKTAAIPADKVQAVLAVVPPAVVVTPVVTRDIAATVAAITAVPAVQPAGETK